MNKKLSESQKGSQRWRANNLRSIIWPTGAANKWLQKDWNKGEKAKEPWIHTSYKLVTVFLLVWVTSTKSQPIDFNVHFVIFGEKKTQPFICGYGPSIQNMKSLESKPSTSSRWHCRAQKPTSGLQNIAKPLGGAGVRAASVSFQHSSSCSRRLQTQGWLGCCMDLQRGLQNPLESGMKNVSLKVLGLICFFFVVFFALPRCQVFFFATWQHFCGSSWMWSLWGFIMC